MTSGRSSVVRSPGGAEELPDVERGGGEMSKRLDRHAQTAALVRYYQAARAMTRRKALRRFVQEHSFQRMVVSPAKLRSLYRSRHARTNQQAIDALREGYPNLCPAEGAKMKVTALAKYLKLPVGRVM